VQQRDRAFHYPAVHAQAGAVFGAAPCDARSDLEPADLVAVGLVVVAAVRVQVPRALERLSALAADRWHRLDQRDQLGDVVAVAAGQRDGEGDAVPVTDDVVFGARFGTVDRARTGFGRPLSARTWELSITALDQSSWSAACSSASSSSCSLSHTPASCQSPQPPPARHP
jgi:hypothetical protein